MRFWGNSRYARLIIFLPIAIFAWFSPAPANGEAVGLNVKVYQVGYDIPPQRSDSIYPLCEGADTYYSNVQQGWGGDVVANCAYDQVMIHYEGFITIPAHNINVSFLIFSDDGGWVDIGGNEFGYWGDRGCDSTWSGYLDIPAGTYTFNDWFYENGGGTCNQLMWSIDYGPWEVVPAAAFSTDLPPVTTTTTAPYLNQPKNVSIIEVTETSVSVEWGQPDPSNIDVERYAIFYSCDNWQSGFAVASTSTSITIYNLPSATECQFKVRADNDTSAVYSEFSSIVTSLTLTPTTLPPTTTIPETTTTVPETTLPPTTTVPSTTTTIKEPSTTTIPPVTVPETTTTIPDNPTTTTVVDDVVPEVTIPEPSIPEDIVSAPISEILTAFDSPGVTEEQIQNVVAELIASEISSEDAAELATSLKVLESVTSEQAAEIFDAIDTGDLSDEQAQLIVDAVQNAPTEVKKQFENQVNVFNDKFSKYVPVGSTVPISTRRVIIAATAAVLAVPSPATSSSTRQRK